MRGEGQPANRNGVADSNGHFVIAEVCEGVVEVRAAFSGGRGNSRLIAGAVQAYGGDTNIVVRLGATNSLPAPASR